MGDIDPDVLQSSALSPSSFCVVQISTLPKFFDQWRNITSNGVVLNMVKGHNPQLRCYSCVIP